MIGAAPAFRLYGVKASGERTLWIAARHTIHIGPHHFSKVVRERSAHFNNAAKGEPGQIDAGVDFILKGLSLKKLFVLLIPMLDSTELLRMRQSGGGLRDRELHYLAVELLYLLEWFHVLLLEAI
jgi:hypothetical protein